MSTYYYAVIPNSTKAGYDTTILVYSQSIRTKEFYLAGYDNEINIATYDGETAVVSKILHEEEGYRITKGNELLRKDIKIVKFPELSLI